MIYDLVFFLTLKAPKQEDQQKKTSGCCNSCEMYLPLYKCSRKLLPPSAYRRAGDACLVSPSSVAELMEAALCHHGSGPPSTALGDL